jgi:hypothetical protein
MSRTLTLIPAGWEAVRQIAKRGQRVEALAQLTRLLARPDVPVSLAVEGHRLAGELASELGRFASARRHLKTAATLEPDNAHTCYLSGLAWEDDPDGSDRRAAICFRKAVTLEATNALYRAAFGRAAARCGAVRLGTCEMLAATDAAPGDMDVIRVAVGGLLEVGKPAKARRVLTCAQFLCPNNRELAGLAERVKFEMAQITQRKMAKLRWTTRDAQDAHFATDGDRAFLPFVRLAHNAPRTDSDRATASATRRDTISFPRPHLGTLRVGKSDQS